MRPIALSSLLSFILLACGGTPPAESPESGVEASDTPSSQPEGSGQGGPESPTAGEEENQFQLKDSDSAAGAQGATPSKIRPTATEAAMKFIVVDKDKGPIPGIVISLTAPNGQKYYTPETDPAGYTEVLVPVGQKYELVYLSLGRKDVAASVPVTDEPNQNIKLTLRYKRYEAKQEPRFVLNGVTFDTAKATIRPESFPRLDSVVEYMTHKKRARIQISGHTDNVGNPKANKKLSEDRANACRDYLINKGIDGSRIEAIGYGDERPIAPNDSDEGRQRNRRIEAAEL